MRDALVLLTILATIPVIVRYPFAGLIAWAWFTIMTPHQLAYGVYGVPLNAIIAGVTLGAYAFTGSWPKLRIGSISVLAILFAFWLIISQLFSLDPDHSAPYFDRFIKTMFFAVLCMLFADTKLKVHALLWITTAGIGFFAAKGALFTLATFGQFRVQGLENSVLEDNNHMGIAIATVLPLILYLRGQVINPVIKFSLTTLFALCIVAILGTHSRGAFVALVFFGGYFWLQSKHKFAIGALFIAITLPAVSFMPAKWHERMTTIRTATEDESFMGRVDAWVINWKFAVENPVTGAGLRNPYEASLAEQIDPMRAESAKAAHSIYFEVLGGAGFVGLGLYLGMYAAAFLTAIRLARDGPGGDQSTWSKRFGRYAALALMVFGLGGASASMEMWDGYLVLVACIAATARITNAPAANTAATDVKRKKERDGLAGRPWRGLPKQPSRRAPRAGQTSH